MISGRKKLRTDKAVKKNRNNVEIWAENAGKMWKIRLKNPEKCGSLVFKRKIIENTLYDILKLIPETFLKKLPNSKLMIWRKNQHYRN